MSHTFDDGVVLDTPDEIRMYHLLATRSALHLELLGMRHSRGSVSAHVKRTYHLKGNRRAVYRAFCQMHGLRTIEEQYADDHPTREPDGHV